MYQFNFKQMKKTVFLLLLGIFATTLHAQDVIKQDDNVIQFGIGAGDGIPFEITYERCLADDLFGNDNGAYGLGGYASVYNHKYHGENTSYYTIGVKEYLHYQFMDNLDTYGSLMLGLKMPNTSSPDHLRFAMGLTAGARYYFDTNVAAYTEVGYGISNISVGISVKF